jgi:hypothetical protein
MWEYRQNSELQWRDKELPPILRINAALMPNNDESSPKAVSGINPHIFSLKALKAL